MDWLRLFTSFSGRIGRFQFLLGIAVVLILSPLALALLFAKTGVITMLNKLGVAGMVWWLVLLYPVSALLVKRFRDRGRPVIMAALFVLPALIVILASYSAWKDVASAFIGLLNVALIAIAVWFLIELGAYPGTVPATMLMSKSGAKGTAKATTKSRKAKA